MITPDYLADCAAQIEALYSELEREILTDVTDRILATDFGVSGTAAWRVEKLQQAGMVYDEALKRIAAATNKSERDLRRLFEDAGVEVFDYGDEVYRQLGISPLSIKQSPAMTRVLMAGLKKTNKTMRNLTNTTANNTQSEYISACDMAYMAVSSGAFSYNEAVRMAVQQASKAGAYVRYPSGRRDHVDVAARRAVLTGLGQTCGTLSEMACDEMDCDLVEVTAHYGARPSHAEWQGKVYSRSGKTAGYPDFEVCQYGEGPGLCGWNCRHSFHAYFAGYSTRNYTDAELYEMRHHTVSYNGETYTDYEASQIQRGIERKIRESKRKLLTLEHAQGTTSGELQRGFKTDHAAESLKLRKYNAKLNDFLAQTGRIKDHERVRVAGFRRYQAQKATQAGTRALTAKRKDGIIPSSKKTGAVDVHLVGKIDIDKYNCVSRNIKTDQVIITDERIKHIKERHPNDYEKYFKYVPEMLEKPGYILEGNKPNTAFVLKKFTREDEQFQLIVRLSTIGDPDDYLNSVITFLRIKEKRYDRYLRTKKILYRSE